MLAETEWGIILLSAKIGAVAVLAGFPVAFACAWILARTTWPGRFLLDILVHLPLVLPPIVTGWGLLILFGRNGVIGHWLWEAFRFSFVFQWTGAALAAAVMALPLMVRSIRLALEAIDPGLENAARTLGATPQDVLWRVTMPLALPGFIAAGLLGFARALGEFGATITFVASVPGQTETLPLAIYAALQAPDGEARVVRLALFSVALSVLALVAAEWLHRQFRRRGGIDVQPRV